MNVKSLSMLGAVAALTFGAFIHNAAATTQVVSFNRLTESASIGPSLDVGDTLLLNTLVTQEVGALTQSITFEVGSSVSLNEGFADWLVTDLASTGPRLTHVKIDLSGPVSTSDSFIGFLGGFAHSTLGPIVLLPGTYKLLATGIGERDSLLNVSLTLSAVPEPEIYGLLIAGLGFVAFARLRRKQQAR